MHVRWLKISGITTALALTLSLAGCGQPATQNQQATTGNTGNGGTTQQPNPNATDAAGNPVFRNSLKLEVGALDKNYDPQSASTSTFTQVQAENAQGQKVTLDAAKHPIIFAAYWCPHCQRTLVMLTKNEKKLHQLPIIISMGFQPGTTLAEAKKLTTAEHTTLGLSNQFKIYYGLYTTSQDRKYVPFGYPTMAFSDGSGVKMLYGEHTLNVWQHALAIAK